MSIDCDIQSATTHAFPATEKLMHWVEATLRSQAKSGQLSLRFVDIAEMQTLNATYRKKDKPTNVLSFPNPLPEDLKDEYLGDIVICAPVIHDEAMQQHKTVEAHYAHMIVHGILHLLGYDHVKAAEAIDMEQREINILATLGFSNPYGISSTHD